MYAFRISMWQRSFLFPVFRSLPFHPVIFLQLRVHKMGGRMKRKRTKNIAHWTFSFHDDDPCHTLNTVCLGRVFTIYHCHFVWLYCLKLSSSSLAPCALSCAAFPLDDCFKWIILYTNLQMRNIFLCTVLLHSSANFICAAARAFVLFVRVLVTHTSRDETPSNLFFGIHVLFFPIHKTQLPKCALYYVACVEHWIIIWWIVNLVANAQQENCPFNEMNCVVAYL